MRRFFFDIYDGEQFIPDREGMELESIEAAKLKAQELLPEMTRDKFPDCGHRVFVVVVRSQAGKVVLRLRLSLIVEESGMEIQGVDLSPAGEDV